MCVVRKKGPTFYQVNKNIQSLKIRDFPGISIRTIMIITPDHSKKCPNKCPFKIHTCGESHVFVFNWILCNHSNLCANVAPYLFC